jgi:hypothetical protein
LWICAVLVKSKHRENTGLISQRQHYSKDLIPCRSRALDPEEFLPGDGKIFTTAAPSAVPFARSIAAIETMRV